MQIKKYQKKIKNLPIGQRNKMLLLDHTFKNGINNQRNINQHNQLNRLSLFKENLNNQKFLPHPTYPHYDHKLICHTYQKQVPKQSINDQGKYCKTSTIGQNSDIGVMESQNGGKSGMEEDIVKICHKNLMICSKMSKQGKFKEAEIVLVVILQAVSELGRKSVNYEWKLIKMKVTLVKAEIIVGKIENNWEVNEKQCQFIVRLPLFCKQLEKDQKYYSFLSEDFYSFIEVIYFIAIKSFTMGRKMLKKNLFDLKKAPSDKSQIFLNIIKNKKNILELIQNCRLCLSKQLQKLCVIITQIHDKKIFRIIQQKSQLLLKLYGFQLAVLHIQGIYQKIQKSTQQTQQNYLKYNPQISYIYEEEHLRNQIQAIKNKIWFKYQNVFKIVPNCLDNSLVQNQVLNLFINGLREVSGITISVKGEKNPIQLSIDETKEMNYNNKQGVLFSVLNNFTQKQFDDTQKLQTVVEKQKSNQGQFIGSFLDSQVENNEQETQNETINKHQFDIISKPKVVIHEAYSKDGEREKKQFFHHKIDSPKLARPSILVKHNLISQQIRSENPITKTELTSKYLYGSEGKNKKKVIILENQEQFLTTPKFEYKKVQTHANYINFPSQLINQENIVKQIKYPNSNYQSTLSVTNLTSLPFGKQIQQQTTKTKINSQKANGDINSVYISQNMKKGGRRSQSKSVTNQFGKSVRLQSIGKRIYKMEVFKMALIPNPFKISSKLYFQSKIQELNPLFQRVKRSKSQKMTTILPGLLTRMEKKQNDKKLVLNKKPLEVK